MGTAKQIAANRRNARNSTGPRTKAGKAQSRLNAIRHGLLSVEQNILPGEDPKVFQALADEIAAELEPQSALEHHLVATIVSCIWRLRRLREVETGIYAYSHQGILAEHAWIKRRWLIGHEGSSVPLDPSMATIARAHHAQGKSMTVRGLTFIRHETEAGVFEKLSRYEARISRRLSKAMTDLELGRQRRVVSRAVT